MTTVKISNQGAPVSLEQIEQFERRNGIVLPDSYKTFLLCNNGGEPMPDRLLVPGWYGQSTAVNHFFGLGGDSSDDLETMLPNVEDYVPKGYVPIVDDPGGNLFCLHTGNSQHGAIYFWDHEELHGDDPRNLRKVAGSIDELLDKLLSSEK